MLNFAEQTGSGAVMLVWSFPLEADLSCYIYRLCIDMECKIVGT